MSKSSKDISKQKLQGGLLFLLALFIATLFINYVNHGIGMPYWLSSRKLNIPTINSITDKSQYKYGTLEAPAVYIQLKGGLGNQLFQYACQYAIARKNNWPLYTYVSSDVLKSHRTYRPNQREFALDYFKIPFFKWNMVDESWNVSKNIERVNESQILSFSYPRDKIISLRGIDYCLSEVFFSPYKEEVIKMFTPKIKKPKSILAQSWLNLIDSEKLESVAVHIRLTDFVVRNLTLPVSFYKEAMENITKMLKEGPKPTFFIFTDDVDSVKKDFPNVTSHPGLKDEKMYFVSQSKNLSSLEEFHLMMRCKHQIIPTSSFSWWSAYLNPNPNKIVIAAKNNLTIWEPMYQVSKKEFAKFVDKHLYYPYDWITVDPF